jgi:hypothetical protein
MPVVLVHGVPETTAVWDRLVPLLDGPVITLGLPRFANKHPEGFGSTMDEYAAWLEAELNLRYMDATKRKPEFRADRIKEVVALLEGGEKDRARG